MTIILPVLSLVVIVTPYVIAAVVALFRRDDFFVSHSTLVQTRIAAGICMVIGVLAWVAVQPRYFQPARDGVATRFGASDDPVRGSIESHVKAMLDSVPCAAVVVGVVQPSGNHVVGFGRRSVFSQAPPDGETVFEIGGMTQVFTTSLLARLVEKNLVRLDQPLGSFLPDTVSVPIRAHRQIELQHLATWTSGLPRLAAHSALPALGVLPPFSRAGPARSSKWLYDLLSSLEIAHPPGTHFDDSDLGMGLLGHALELAAKTDYEALLQREICGPLGLNDTRIMLTPAMKSRLATGMRLGAGSYQGWYVASPDQRWPEKTIPGAADLCSTTNDLLTLLRAHLAGFPLAEALGETRRMRHRVAGRPDVGLGWYIEWTGSGQPIVWQHGARGASRGYMAFLPDRGVGVVVLANVPVDVALLGKMLLNRLLAPTT